MSRKWGAAFMFALVSVMGCASTMAAVRPQAMVAAAPGASERTVPASDLLWWNGSLPSDELWFGGAVAGDVIWWREPMPTAALWWSTPADAKPTLAVRK